MKFWQRLEKLLLLIFLVLIPTQLGRHYWPDWSLVRGIRVDYLSPTLYVEDLIIGGLIIISFLRKRFLKYSLDFGDFLTVLMIVVNVVMAANRMEAGYKWIRIGEWVWMLSYLRNEKNNVDKYLKYAITGWILLESLLVLAQVIKGGSVEGLFWWLGERRFRFSSLGTAQINIMGQGLVRGYGTFSHPNSLAGFLLVSIILWMREKRKGLGNVWWWMVWWMAIGGIIMCGSRTVWVLTIGLIVWVLWQNKKIMLAGIMMTIGLILTIFLAAGTNYDKQLLVGGWDDQSLEKRITLTLAAAEMIKTNPLFGVGAGNYLVQLPNIESGRAFYWLQPVHNIGLLAWSEIGLLGLITLFTELKLKLFEKTNWRKKEFMLIWAAILITGAVDHYWLTLPQNSWLLCVVLGLV